MNFRTFRVLAILFLVCIFAGKVTTQTPEDISKTWKGSGSSGLMNELKAQQSQRVDNHKVNLSVVQFKPIGDTTVEKSLADAFGGTEEEKAALAELFQQIHQAYDAEVGKEGKSNNLAAAFTFFIAGNVMAYRQTVEPSEKATQSLFDQLEKAISNVPEFAQMSDLEKERMNDWLVCMGGFAMTGFVQAQQSKDEKGMQTYSQLADYSMHLVLGVDASKLNFQADQFLVESAGPSVPANATDQRILGIWSKSASSPWGTDAATMSTNAGYYKGQYQFKTDGTYSFKGESWGGPLRSEEFWTIEENGKYNVQGESLIISPDASKATLRNRAGVTQKTQNNPLEKVTYIWKLHYFEGIQETNLVLKPDRQTMRDGGFAGNSDFPNSYLYSQNGNLEWRY